MSYVLDFNMNVYKIILLNHKNVQNGYNVSEKVVYCVTNKIKICHLYIFHEFKMARKYVESK